MTAQAVRQAFLTYARRYGHVVIERASLVPENDPTTLFTGSGMQPINQLFFGRQPSHGKKIADSQTCLRVEDIVEVGDNRHTTFFEMLGNWSFGDYFKAEQLERFFEFLTKDIGLDRQNCMSVVSAEMSKPVSKRMKSRRSFGRNYLLLKVYKPKMLKLVRSRLAA